MKLTGRKEGGFDHVSRRKESSLSAALAVDLSRSAPLGIETGFVEGVKESVEVEIVKIFR